MNATCRCGHQKSGCGHQKKNQCSIKSSRNQYISPSFDGRNSKLQPLKKWPQQQIATIEKVDATTNCNQCSVESSRNQYISPSFDGHNSKLQPLKSGRNDKLCPRKSWLLVYLFFFEW